MESPAFFGKVIEWAYEEARVAGKWEGDTMAMPGLMVDGVAFMDDGVLWEGGVDRLRKKVEDLTAALRRWGLSLNHSKSRLYVSPHAVTKPMLIEGTEVKADDHLEVMNIRFKVGATATELMQPVFAMARRKFWAHRHVLIGKGSIKDKLTLFSRVVTNSAPWCSPAIVPDQQALSAANAHLMLMITWMTGSKRKTGEEWLHFHLRSLRAARAVAHQYLKERWSTTWLRRLWGYAGHRARSLVFPRPPASAIVDKYRCRVWWSAQQEDPKGIRHPGRFYPRLYNFETIMDEVCGTQWRQAAEDRTKWKGLEDLDVPWASGGQSMLPW